MFEISAVTGKIEPYLDFGSFTQAIGHFADEESFVSSFFSTLRPNLSVSTGTPAVFDPSKSTVLLLETFSTR